MQNPPSPRDPADRTRSKLALLVETEQRLDGELAAARERALALEAAARARIAEADAALTAALAAERDRIAADLERDTAARLHALEAATERELVRLAAVRDERADAIARRIAGQLVARVLAEDVP